MIPASWLPLAAGNELSQSSLRLLFYVNFMYTIHALSVIVIIFSNFKQHLSIELKL